jgi:hypothetical protein
MIKESSIFSIIRNKSMMMTLFASSSVDALEAVEVSSVESHRL